MFVRHPQHCPNIKIILCQRANASHLLPVGRYKTLKGGGPMVVVRGSFPGVGGLKVPQIFLLHPLVILSIMGSLLGRGIACSASDLQGLNFEDPVSGGLCHLTHLTILRRFSWPNLACICTKVA